MKVIITGASRGIGYELVKKFSYEERMKLYIISRNKEKLEFLKSECLKINPHTDISIIPADLEKLNDEELIKHLGTDHIDILINNAGALVNKPFLEISSDESMKMLGTNFLVPAWLIRQLYSFMGGKSPTHVVNIGSMGGMQGSVKFPGLSLYSASKGALAVLTECLAEEFNGENIFINYLALGAVQTEMLSQAFPGYKAPLSAEEMATFVAEFALNGFRYFNGKILPVSLSTP